MAIDTERDYIELLDILIHVIDENKGTPSVGDERILDAEGLGLKFFGHALSALYLVRGVTIPELTVPITKFPDSASLHVLGRAAIETFLIFHYIFEAPQNELEKNFRYQIWQLSGLLERQSFPVWSKEAKEKLRSEEEIKDNLVEKIELNSNFVKLTTKQQKSIIQKGNWKFQSWKEIGLSAGLSDVHAESYYRYLCGYAHSGNLSVFQVRQTRTYQEKREMMNSTINLLLIAIANMIKCYCGVFPKSKNFYVNNYQPKNTVDLWVDIGASTKAEIEKAMENT